MVRGARGIQLRRLQPTESRELHGWISARHYLKSCPPGHRYALEFMLGAERIGGMLLGRPDARSLDERIWLQLTRMLFVDDTPVNVESQGLAMMRKWVRVWVPECKGLLSYSDPEVGHAGTVYLADGWAPFGTTNNGGKGWQSRPGRKGGDGKPSRKTRWVRTP